MTLNYVNILPIQKVKADIKKYIFQDTEKEESILLKHTRRVQIICCFHPLGLQSAQVEQGFVPKTLSALLAMHEKTTARVHWKNEITWMRNEIIPVFQ